MNLDSYPPLGFTLPFQLEGKDSCYHDVEEFLQQSEKYVALHLPSYHFKRELVLETMDRLAPNLQTNTTLLLLNLTMCNMGPKGAEKIVRALLTHSTLGTNPPLQRLDLSWNNIGKEGAQMVGQLLEFNNNLEVLHLSVNMLDSEDVQVIIRGLIRNRNNTSLKVLDISDNEITRLPAELAQCPSTLIKFKYHGNPIDYIPLNVERWLDRFQNQQNYQIDQDSQSVHNRQIQQCIKDSLNRILDAGPPIYKTFEEVRDVIVNDSILSPECKTQLIEYASDPTEHTELRVTFAEALQYVFTRIEINEHKEGIKDILNKEMSDALCKCFTGRISRLIDCLNSIDNLVVIDLSPNDRINGICLQVYELLRQEGEASLTAENYQATVENVLKERGFDITEEIQDKYLAPIIQDFANEHDE